MKKIVTLTLACLIASTIVKSQTFSDDFESYTLTTPVLGLQSPDWRTWGSTTGGGTTDVAVINTDNHTVAGAQSIYFSSTSSTGGPQDVVLPFGASPLTTGQFTYSMWLKIPTGKSSYFNFQGNATMGNMYSLDCFMTGGNISVQNQGTPVATATHPFGTWFQLTINANFNTNVWELMVDGVSQGTWSNANNQVYAIDIYPADAVASFWVDDVSYNVVPYTLPAINAAGNLVSFVGVASGLVNQNRSLQVKVKNLGTTTINSFDLSIVQNGGAPIPQTVTGLTLASLGTTTVNVASPFTLAAGVNTFTATVSNVNGMGPDGDSSDDVSTKTMTPVVPATGKMVVGEEGTGTWCQWCPRGAVYMGLMAQYYDTYYAGIAVHNADPMTLTNYDAGISSMIGGYPSALVDRTPEIDPSALESTMLTRIVVAPKAFIVNGATYNSGTRVLKVSLTTTIQTAISGNYKVACVLTEDGVTGTTGYAQSNAYSGGAAGPMGGFESLGNPVPASLMVYDHVARVISPDFAGQANAYGTSAAAAAVFTHTFTYTLPATWDANEIHIVGMFIDPTGTIDNASSATIAEAVTNGYVSGTEIGTVGIAETNAVDAMVSLYPNPASSNANINLNLDKESTVEVAIYSVNGALVAKKDYGKLSGGMIIPVDLTDYKPGMYFINVTIDGVVSVQKLIKE